MSYSVDRKSQSQSEVGLLMPRLKSFALALTGSETKALALLRATRNHALARVDKDRGHTSVALWTFIQMRKIWAKRGDENPSKANEADPRLFQPMSRADDGGPSARMAMKLARLSPKQRGVLHLVYGERLSYDEAAEIFEVSIPDIMSCLVKAHTAIAGPAPQDKRAPQARSPQTHALQQDGYQQGQAA